MTSKYKIAYVSRVIYPSSRAHALQTIQMAAAFANRTGDAHLFVRDIAASKEYIRQHYDINGSPLQIWSLHANRLPMRLRGVYGLPSIFNSAIATILGLKRTWRLASVRRKVLFNRGIGDFTYWGLMRPHLLGFRKWIFVYEAHDVAGLRPEAALEENPFDLQDGSEGRRRQRQFRAMKNYDLILCVTQVLSDDLKRWSSGRLQPHVVRHASALPRLPRSPELRPFGDRVLLGYIGTIDTYRGIDKLLMAMRFLPENYVLRLVGRVPDRSNNGQDPEWLRDLLHDPDISSKVELFPCVPVHNVVEEIDRCDILLQPASSHILTLRYASPLKSFDYMVRGKPIVAADVPCHRELFQDGVNALLYRYDDVEHIAASIKSMIEQPQRAESIARRAWEQSAEYTYDARARRILDLVDEVWKQRKGAR